MLNRSMLTKLAAAGGVAGMLIAGTAAPTFARGYGHGYRHHHAYRHNSLGAAIGGFVGGTLAGATALATAPFYGPYSSGPYAYDRYGPAYQAYAYEPAPFADSAAGQCVTPGAQGRTWSVC